MRWKSLRSLLFTAVTLAWITACQTGPGPISGSLTPESPAPVGSVEPSSTPIPRETLPSNAEVLAACDLSLQEKALRKNQLPEWETLGLDTCYNLTFNLNNGSPNYSGLAEITFSNSSSTPLNDIVLRTFPNAPVLFGGSLEISSARAGDISLPVEGVLDDQSAVRLILNAPLQPGAAIQLLLEFSGSLPQDFPSDQIYGTYHYSTDGPVMMLANAYPMLAMFNDGAWQYSPVLAEGDAVISRTALYRVEVHVPTGWQVAASGVETSREESSGERVVRFAGGPLRDFMLAASPAFELRESDWEDIHIQHWGLSASEPGWEEAIKVTHEALTIFDQTFGALLYSELDVIAAPLHNASGVEYPGLILIGESLYSGSSIPRLLPMVVAHETAHQWWYSVIGNDPLEHPWQDEALATYSAQLYSRDYSPGFYRGALAEYQKRVERVEATSGIQKVDQSVADFSDNPQNYAAVVYLKGNLFLEALREMVGEDVFTTALQSYYAQNLYGLAQPEALLDSFETACKCQLDEMYAEWGVQP